MEKFEDLNLSLEQEIKHEDTLKNLLEVPDTVEEVKDIISQYREIAENSKNSRTIPIISKCSQVMANGFLCPEFHTEIEEGIEKQLFPLLYNNILENKERVKPEDLVEMFLNVSHTNSYKLREHSKRLLNLINPKTKKILKKLIDERITTQ